MLSFSINSCSNDSNGKSNKATGTLSFKVDGDLKTLNIIYVDQIKQLVGTPYEYTQITVSAYSTTTDNAVTFSFKKGDLGNTFSDFAYILGGDMGYLKTSDFSSTITASGNENKLIGTFAGHVGSDTFYDFNITAGSFNIQY